MLARFRSLIKALFRRDNLEDQMDLEMRSHLEAYAEDLTRSGLSRQEAERRARIEFGGVELAQEQCRQARGLRFFDELRQDLAYSIRIFGKNPGFCLIAIIAIALGIGSNSAVFSVLYSVILKPLPFKDPARIVAIGEVNRAASSPDPLFSPANYIELERQQQSFEAVATLFYDGVKYEANGETENLPGFDVTAGFFATLGVAPVAGRTFTPQDMAVSPANTVVISYRLWQRRFGGDPRILGQTLVLSKEPYTVIGIMPENFRAPLSFDSGELWLPEPQNNPQFQDRSDRYMRAFGRLRPGVTIIQAQREMDVIAARLARDYPASNKGWSINVASLADSVTGEVRPALLILFSAGCCVLLVACANLANLLLARANARTRELGIRAALGATRGRLIRQALTESVALTLPGGALGAALASWTINIVRELKPGDLPRVDELRIDIPVLLFTLTATVAAGCACGAIAGWLSTSVSAGSVLNENGSRASIGVRQTRVRNILIIAEISLTLVLLVSAGLLTRSLYRLTQEDPGFDSHNLFTGSVSGRLQTPKQNSRFYQQLIEKVQRIPGIDSAALVTAAPLVNNTISFPFSVKGESVGPADKVRTAVDSITPDFLKTLKISLKAGRDITVGDRFGGPGVALVNESLARRYFASNDRALGREIEIVYLGTPIVAQIVGVVGDTKRDSLATAMQPSIYLPEVQVPWFSATIVARTKSDPGNYTRPIQQVVHEMDSDQDVFAPGSMDEALTKSVAQPRFYSLLFGCFALIAVILACVGLYGVISYTASQRTQEIGIRVALGAKKSDILISVLGGGMALVTIGVLLGLGESLITGRLLATLLYEVSPIDGVSYLSVTAPLTAVALLACYIPARRAANLDPMAALRLS
ncbi:MAG TPA: ABC transporter permease [Blastocatellia bacterium]|nr:ABC transporter permease [Blastocatellia bacterium]